MLKKFENADLKYDNSILNLQRKNTEMRQF